MNYLIVLALIANNICALILLQIEVPSGQKGLEYVVIGGLVTAVVSLAIYVRAQNKEVKDAHKNTTETVEKFYEKSISEYRAIVERNTAALIENTKETRHLTEFIRDKLIR